MNFDFQQIIDALNTGLPRSDNFAFVMARATVIPADYVLNRFLPEENMTDYNVNGGFMTIWPTMLGQVAMDSPYPPMGAVTSEQFFERTTKLAGQMFFPEKAQRDLQAWTDKMISMGVQDGLSNDQIFGGLTVDGNGNGNNGTINGRRLNALLSISRSMLKAHWDTREWLRGLAIFNDEIDWTFNKIPLKVSYGTPSDFKQTNRTGNNRYGGSTSMFWEDVRWLNTKLSNFILVMNENTWLSIINQSANNITVVVNDGLIREIIKDDISTVRQRVDVRDRVRIIVYNGSGTVINAKTGELQAEQFVPDGKIAAIGDLRPAGFELMQGSVANPANNLQFGYTHIAPTVEGGGRPGTWARIYTPEAKPMQVLAETAVNTLPAILQPKRRALLSTAMS